MLLREMEHRIKNLFNVAASVVDLSMRGAESPQELAGAVRQRLSALARAHALTLTKPEASDAEAARSTTLHDLIETIVAPYQAQRPRVVIAGIDCPVAGAAVTSLALLINEFATNAAKYGSLSTPDGLVRVTCTRQDDQIHIVWAERGGPSVRPPDGAAGFGSLLIQGVVKQLEGDVLRDWRPDGLVVRVIARADRLIT